MKKKSSGLLKVGFLVTMVLLLSFSVFAQRLGNGPVAVSPGSETEVTVIWQTCPTFSWSSVVGAGSYRIAVFQAMEGQWLSYEGMVSQLSPVINKDISGAALSWTLSVEERLQTDTIYIWYVQAVDDKGNALGLWSNGKLFKVEQEALMVGIEGKLRDIIKLYGVSDNVIAPYKKDLKESLKAGGVGGTKDKTVLDRSGVLGTEGTNTTFYGLSAGASNTTGWAPTFFGRAAGYSNTTGDHNSFFGYYAGYRTTYGYNNTFIGNLAGYSNISGDTNTFIGKGAGYFNSDGWGNTFLGVSAGYGNTTGDYNTFIGVGAGSANTTGNANTYLGYQAGASETGSNKLYIDNSNTSAPLIYGEFDTNVLVVNGKLGISRNSPAYPIHMASGAYCSVGGTWTNASSRALKENIEDLNTAEAMAALTELTPVKYNYKTDKTDQYVGFIAEDVPQLVATPDRKGLSPMDVTAVLTKVVQEQQNMIHDLQKENQEYKKIIADIQSRMTQLEKK